MQWLPQDCPAPQPQSRAGWKRASLLPASSFSSLLLFFCWLILSWQLRWWVTIHGSLHRRLYMYKRSLSEEVLEKNGYISLSFQKLSLVEQRMLVPLAWLQKSMFGQLIRFAWVHALNREIVFYWLGMCPRTCLKLLIVYKPYTRILMMVLFFSLSFIMAPQLLGPCSSRIKSMELLCFRGWSREEQVL